MNFGQSIGQNGQVASCKFPALLSMIVISYFEQKKVTGAMITTNIINLSKFCRLSI